MQKVVWDMDPGIDDALALILALESPEVQIVGVSAVAGNAPVEMTGANARRVLEYMGAGSIPVAIGRADPLNRPLEDALSYHGADGLGNCDLPPPRLPLLSAKGWDFLAQSALDAPGEIALVATGPLANVARAFELHPELPRRLAKMVLMGGAYGLTPYGKGNRTPFAEFNMWQDPEAAQVVFRTGPNILAVGLDITMDPQACLNGQHLEQIRGSSSKAARLAAQLVGYDIEHHGLCRMHDPLALAVLLDPSLFDFVSAQVGVVGGNGWDRGITRVQPSGSSQSIQIASAVKGPRFLKLFLSRVLED